MTTNVKHETGVVGEGQRLLEQWLHAKDRLRSAERQLNSVECDLRNTETELVRWLLPKEAVEGEKIGIWFGDSLIQVECTGHISPDLPEGKVTIRQAGKTISEALWR